MSEANLHHLLEKLELLVSENQSLKIENKSLRSLVEETEPDASKVICYNNELEQFTYVATHDLKTPLANISGYLDLLEMDLENPSEDIKDSIKWLKYSVREAMNVIKELTSALKARNDKADLLIPINMDNLVESILSGMRSTIKQKKVLFICDFTEIDEFPYYQIALRSILQNLISNAILYLDPKKDGVIRIHTEKRSDDSICISIEDNGVGIDLEKNREKLLGLFKRVTNDGSGSGIGMYIINKLLENYGGQLEIESEVGIGSTFRIILPLTEKST
ncbi:MAG: HAMP domain-containing histidine kinase [Crocinitomicaceae bacterium]|nr:HAMP domain-containing histidine kinase [Flavobacteriales bacterium]NQZ38110.1 HAMP domain-containing histidine kinase [Crocinitomicaceae bacterium]